MTKRLMTLFALVFIFSGVQAQNNITGNAPLVENFNSMTGTNLLRLPVNWKMSAAGRGSIAAWNDATNLSTVSLSASSGSPTTGGRYNWGTSAGVDRAVGFMTSSSYTSPNAIMAYYRNQTGKVITSLAISFQVERYRVNTSAFSLNFFISRDGSAWQSQSAGDIASGIFATAFSTYYFTTPRTVYRTIVMTGLNIENNGDFYLKWLFNNAGSLNAQGLGLDNVSVEVNTPLPDLHASLQDILSFDRDNNGKANIGDTITYRSIINNEGGIANQMNYEIMMDTNLSAVSNLRTSALANNDYYFTPLNTGLNGVNILGNDFGLPFLTITSFGPTENVNAYLPGTTGISDNGGSIKLQANGSLIYQPPGGFTGEDRFAYRVSCGALSGDRAVVSISVGQSLSASSVLTSVSAKVLSPSPLQFIMPEFPKNKTLQIEFDASIMGGCSVSLQGALSGSNFSSVLSDDPKTAMNGDVTVTGIQNLLPPVISCSRDITVSCDPGSCGAFIDLSGMVSAKGQCSEAQISLLPASNSFFETGTTTVHAIATDADGLSSSCSFTVTVMDNEKPVINCSADITIAASPGACSVKATTLGLQTPQAMDNCGVLQVRSKRSDNALLSDNYPIGPTEITWIVYDVHGNTSSCTQTITVTDDQAPVIKNESSDKSVLWPPNHKMMDVYIGYEALENCGEPVTSLSVTSSDPENGTGDGDTAPDWIIVDNHHVQLRAERAATGEGRTYNIHIDAVDAQGNRTGKNLEVKVSHNITGPLTGKPFQVGSTVDFSGIFWDRTTAGHTGKWLIDDNTSVKGQIVEPAGNKNGRITGSYKFTTPGVYKLQMNIIDLNGVTSYANTNGDLEEIIVVYDPNGGYTYGGGWFNSPPGALAGQPELTGKASYGFSVNYFKGATNPRGETQFEFRVGDFEFNALNFDYLVVSGSWAQFKGTGKIMGGPSGIGFIMTVIDGQSTGSSDRIRMKIYNKTTGQVYYDSQPGASDTEDPEITVGNNSTIVIDGKIPLVRLEQLPAAVDTAREFEVRVMPNPATADFKIIISSKNEKVPVNITVFDVIGRPVEHRKINSHGRFGERYSPGTYIMRLTQGSCHKEMLLVKLAK